MWWDTGNHIWNLLWTISSFLHYVMWNVVGAQCEFTHPAGVGWHVYHMWWGHARDVSSPRQGDSSSAAGRSQERLCCQGKQ